MDWIDVLSVGVGVAVVGYSTFRLGRDSGARREWKRQERVRDMVMPVLDLHAKRPLKFAIVTYEFDRVDANTERFTATVVAHSYQKEQASE